MLLQAEEVTKDKFFFVSKKSIPLIDKCLCLNPNNFPLASLCKSEIRGKFPIQLTPAILK